MSDRQGSAAHLRDELARVEEQLKNAKRTNVRARDEWRALLLALGVQPDGEVPLLMAAKEIKRKADEAVELGTELVSARVELDRLRSYVATLERELGRADAAMPVFDQEYL
jgi:hypothetical protein